MFTYIRRAPRPDCTSYDAPLAVQGLAISPTEIAALTERGISSSANNAGLTFVEGTTNPVLTLDMTRGVDVADTWNASKTAAANLIRGHKKDKDYYG